MKPEYLEYIEAIPGIIGCWDLGERAGLVAWDRSKKNPNTAHVGVTLGGPGVGDGRPAPFYDGVGDYTNDYTLSLRGRFNGTAGTAAILARVANAGVWTDGTIRYLFQFAADNNNRALILKSNGNNQLEWRYYAGGISKIVGSLAFGGRLDWIHLAVTWDRGAGVNGEMLAFGNGAQVGATQVALGNWVGVLADVDTNIGARTNTPNDPWHGWLAYGFVLNRAAGPQEIRQWYLKGKQGGMA